MGTLKTYKCNKCGYSVVSSGGKDYGMMDVTDTFICKSCNSLVDVSIGEYGISYLNVDIFKSKKSVNILNLDFYECPECGERKELIKWKNRKRPCPKCDGRMEIDDSAEIIMWD